MINWMVFSTFVLSMAMTILGLLVDLTYQVQFAPKISALQQTQESQLSSYLQKEERLRNHPVFRSRPATKKDFSDLISQLQKGDLQKPLVEEALKKTIYSMGHQWLDQKHKIPKLEAMDVLFSSVRDYDHWDLPFRPDNNLASDLIVLSQVFLAWTFHYQPLGVQDALEKTRILSQILLSTQDLNYKRAGLSILEKENEFMDFINDRSRSARFLWSPVPRAQLKEFRMHLRKTANYLSPLADADVFEQIFLSLHKPIGFCSIMKIKYKMLKWSQDLLTPRFPLEPDFATAVNNLSRVQQRAESECLNWKSEPLENSPWARHIPYYRRIYGAKMILNAEKKRKFL